MLHGGFVLPVVGGVEQGAELTDAMRQAQNLFSHTVRTTVSHARITELDPRAHVDRSVLAVELVRRIGRP